jgi:hypothetical protein
MIEGVPLSSMSIKVVYDMIQPHSDKMVLSEDSIGGSLTLEGGSESFIRDGVGQHSGELDGRSPNEVVGFVGGIHRGRGSGHVVSSKVLSSSS